MSNPAIPRHMTVSRAGYADLHGADCACDECQRGPDPDRRGEVILGHPLTRRMQGYLDDALAGWSMEERILQLEEIDWRCYRAHQLRQNLGWSDQRIMDDLRCSLRTVQRLLKTARDFVTPQVGIKAKDYESRLEILSLQDPQAFRVYLMMGYGWKQADIAKHMDVSLRTVERASVKAQKFLGEWQHRIARRYANIIVKQIGAA